MAFASFLRRHRTETGISQLELALRCGMSQRHISFLETARAQPSRKTVEKLAAALGLAPSGADALLQSAGYSSVKRTWAAPNAASPRQTATELLMFHTPNPAVLMDVAGNVFATNGAFDRALSALGNEASIWRESHNGQPPNIYRLTLHPRGTAQFLLNYEGVAASTLRRAAAEARTSAPLRAMLDEIAYWPGINPDWLQTPEGPCYQPIVTERYRLGRHVASIVAITMSLGTQIDTLDGGLRIESYIPADALSAQTLGALI